MLKLLLNCFILTNLVSIEPGIIHIKDGHYQLHNECFVIDRKEMILRQEKRTIRYPIFLGKNGSVEVSDLDKFRIPERFDRSKIPGICVPIEGDPLALLADVQEMYQLEIGLPKKPVLVRCFEPDEEVQMFFDFKLSKQPAGLIISFESRCKGNRLLPTLSKKHFAKEGRYIRLRFQYAEVTAGKILKDRVDK